MTDNNNYEKLFDIFPTITTKEWEDLIKEDLKGADYEKKLIWKTDEGYNIKPYYRNEDIINDIINVSIEKNDNNWLICQEIYAKNIHEVIAFLNSSKEKGVDSFHFNEIKINSKYEIWEILKNIDFSKTAINFTNSEKEIIVAEAIIEYLKENNIDKSLLKASLGFDPIGHLSINGNYYNSEQNWLSTFEKLYELFQNYPNVKIINISGNYFHNSGANITQEIALSMNVFVEYLDKLSEKGLSIKNIYNLFQFTYSTGSNYFIEIAKLRAVRYIWKKIIESYSVDKDLSAMYIHSESSIWNKSLYDSHVNMLRATTEAMSSIIGGANSLSIKPFDYTYKKQNDFSSRIARNTQIVLKEESLLKMVVDPSKGSYFIEKLTSDIIQESWNLFLEIESQGGYSKAFEAGMIQKLIFESLKSKDLNVSNKLKIILGTNQYANINEKMLEKIEKTSEKNINLEHKFTPLLKIRGSQEFEKLRLRTESSNKSTPKVFLFTIGNLAMRKARASFSSNFFACAGFEIIDNSGFKSIEEGINEVNKVKPEITVICSSDEEYTSIMPEIINQLSKTTILVLAGYPKEQIENFKALGLSNFIHVKSNLLETLKDFQNKLNL